MWRENRELLVRGARALGVLCDEFVFVGGCTTGLLITDPAAPEIRSTRDVDVIAEIASLNEYYRLADRLRNLGFTEDRELTCRWHGRDQIILDVMPTDPAILGFSNPWYAEAVANASRHLLEPELSIRVVTPEYFCATKIAAFHGRGGRDFAASHDLEDLLAVVDGRQALVGEIRNAPENVRRHIANEVRGLLGTRAFTDALPGFLPPDSASQARLSLLVGRLDEIAAIH